MFAREGRLKLSQFGKPSMLLSPGRHSLTYINNPVLLDTNSMRSNIVFKSDESLLQ